MDPFVAEIRIFAFNFAPRGWAWCDGQLLPLSQNTALFSLLGTTYGGDGKSNFALPDLQGSVPIHTGAAQPGPGLSTYFLGQTGGSENVTLLQSETPNHSHFMRDHDIDQAELNAPSPVRSLAQSKNAAIYAPAANFVAMNPQNLTFAGGDQPHNNMMPYLTFYFNIALQGVFPPRP
jgi:microcystin-dependent protein